MVVTDYGMIARQPSVFHFTQVIRPFVEKGETVYKVATSVEYEDKQSSAKELETIETTALVQGLIVCDFGFVMLWLDILVLSFYYNRFINEILLVIRCLGKVYGLLVIVSLFVIICSHYLISNSYN